MVQFGDESDEDGLMLPATSQKFAFRKPICPYVTSTPADFNVERAYLAVEIFPKLHQVCEERGTSFSPIDIQWQPKSMETGTGHLLRIQLDYISKCSPFFICLLGETYGPFRAPELDPLPNTLRNLPDGADWLDQNYLVASDSGYSWVLKDVHQNCSVPELEIIQAAFLTDNRHCHFYYRQPEHLQLLFPGLSEKELENSSDCLIYKPENEYADLNIRDLKQRIVNKGLPVKYFQTKEQLGEMVFSDWLNIIDMLYPPLLESPDDLETEEFREWMAHEVFAESRRRNFLDFPELQALEEELSNFCLSVLDEPFLEAEESGYKYRAYSIYNMLRKPSEITVKNKSLMVIKGDRGTGKSTLVANWVRSFVIDNPEVKVVCLFVGCSGRSRDVATFMRRCVAELRAEFLKEDIDECADVGLVTQSFKELCGSFHAAMSLGPCALVIDGVDELGGSLGIIPQEIKTLTWLPVPLPPQCRMIVTTTASDYSHTCLSKRPDVTFITLPNLNTTKLKTEFLEEHMSMHYDHLNRFSLQTIHDTRLSVRPLFLTVLGIEMSALSVFMDLESYVSTIREICSSVRDLYIRSMRRWSQDHSWTYEVLSPEQMNSDTADFIGWVPDVLRLLAVSRSGLTANELLEILEVIGYQENVKVTVFDWLMLKVGLGEHLTESPCGVINFSHQQMREVVEYTLLRSVKPSTSEIISKSEQGKEWKQQKQEFHRHLVKYFSKMTKNQRRTEELPWQLLMAGDLAKLKTCVTSPEMFLSLVDTTGQNPSNHHDLKFYWHYLEQEGFNAPQSYIELLESLGLISPEQDDKVEIQSMEGSEYDEEMTGEVIESIITIKQPDIQIPIFTSTMPNVPTIFATPASEHTLSIIDDASDSQSKSGDVAKNIDSFVDSSTESVHTTHTLDLLECDLSPSQLSLLMWHMAEFLLELRQFGTTEKILLALNDRLAMNYPLLEEDQLIHAKAQERLGELYIDQRDDASAEKWFKKSLRTVMDMFDTDEQSPIYSTLQTLKAKVIMEIGVLRISEFLLDDAEDLLQEGLETAEVARNIPVRATILFYLGNLRQRQCDYLMAETNLRNCIFLRERWYGKRHPLVADVLINLGRLMADENNDKGFDRRAAQESLRRALDIREHHYNKDHIIVADVLFELGKVLKCATNYASKTECQRMLRRALDIRLTHLGGNHIDTRAVRQYLSNLEVTLRATKHDQRSSERPFSSLSWRGTDMANMERKSRLQSGKSSMYGQSSRPLSQTSRTGSYMSRPTSRSMSRPVSGQVYQSGQLGSGRASIMSASERLMFETNKPRLLHRGAMERKLKNNGFQMASQSSPQISPSGELVMDDSRRHVSLEVGSTTETEPVEYRGTDSLLDSYGQENEISAVKFSNKENRGPRPSSHKSSIQKSREEEIDIGRETPPQRLYRRFGSPHDGESALKIVRKSSSVKQKRPVWSARSMGSSLYTSATPCTSQYAMSLASTKSHKSSCDIPTGPHDIHISNVHTTTMGPNSGIRSLLGPQGPKDLTIDVHHKSAWYHVPGRYSTMTTKYAPKRSQKRPDVKKIIKSIAPTEPDPYQSFMNSEYRTNNPSNPRTMPAGKKWHTCGKGQPPNYYQRTKQYVICETCQSEIDGSLTLLAKRDLERLQEENEDCGTPYLTPTVSGLSLPDRPQQTGFILTEPMTAEDVDYTYPHPGTVVKFQQEAVVMN